LSLWEIFTKARHFSRRKIKVLTQFDRREITAAALLARYGKKVLVCESHSIPGGAAHSFSREGFIFDSGPSFYCGLGTRHPSLNPLKQVLDVLGESLEVPQLNTIAASVGQVMDESVSDSWVRRLLDLECFLLSGLKAHGTVAPEVAFMLGERTRAGVEYPVGGSGAIVQALVRGLKKWGGELRLRAHVDKILVEAGQVTGVKLRDGEILQSPIVISNATIWDTYGKLLSPEDLPPAYRQAALATPAVDSFMHLHLGIKADGLEELTGHHVVVHDSDKDITAPGNTCMISIPSVWDKNLAPPGHHVVHAYTLEPYQNWQKNEAYQQKKQERAQSLYRALRKIIPDLDSRITLELIGTPLTHARFLRRDRGTYGPAIAAGKGMFPSCHTPIAGLYRVGDSTMPGIGVPAVAASGILCANTLVSPWGDDNQR
jgi:phytoene dehydrogenase-like protein